MSKPYVLTSPDFAGQNLVSGGVRVMWGLYGYLLSKGQIAYMNRYPIEDKIAIYPEIQQGNPTGAKTVVRYILNKPGVVPALMSDGSLVKGPTEFAPTDKLYYFSRLYAPDDTPDDKILFLPILDLHTFKNQGKKRTKVAYMVGKGINYPLSPIHPSNAIEIDRGFAQDQQALADFLNTCEVLYCYDPNTAMTEISRLCNVPKIIYSNPLYSKEEFSKYEPGLNGINWGKDEGIVLDYEKFRNHYKNMIKEFEGKLDKFIEVTQYD